MRERLAGCGGDDNPGETVAPYRCFHVPATAPALVTSV